MSNMLILLAIFFPVILGFLSFKYKDMEIVKFKKITFVVILLTSILAIAAMLTTDGSYFELIKFNNVLNFSFKIDGLGKIFGFLVSVLWPITTIYAFEYMKHEGKEQSFFGFFTITYGVVLGLIFSANLLTMYIFYEFLTLITIPLVMHKGDGKAKYAGKKYIIYMMFGAGFAFIGLMFALTYGNGLDFTFGGVFDPNKIAGKESMVIIGFILAFIGFGTKAAVLPMSSWLPDAGVAPTPVTALLHAVAVVKSGAFAIMRVIYFIWGPSLLIGTFGQYIAIILAAATIVYGSAMALRMSHIKRRYAFSTVANLSYILLGLSFMTNLSLEASLMHFVYHAFIKITLFFVAGVLLTTSGKEYLYQINGFGKRMPITFGALAIASLALMGVPPLPGFYSKYYLATSMVESGNPLWFIGVGALLISAFFTALYCMDVLVHGFFYKDNTEDKDYYKDCHDGGKLMNISLIILCVIILVLAFTNKDLALFIENNVLGGAL